MQIIEFSAGVALLVSIILWGIFQTFFAVLCQHLPKKYFKYKNKLFRPKPFEKDGKIYKSIFKINKWKHYLPDGAAVTKSGYKKKHLKDISSENLNMILEQSCRAELSHLLAILPFWIFGFFLPPIAIPIMLLYAILINAPCILAQRYNRPRIINLLERMDK